MVILYGFSCMVVLCMRSLICGDRASGGPVSRTLSADHKDDAPLRLAARHWQPNQTTFWATIVQFHASAMRTKYSYIHTPCICMRVKDVPWSDRAYNLIGYESLLDTRSARHWFYIAVKRRSELAVDKLIHTRCCHRTEAKTTREWRCESGTISFTSGIIVNFLNISKWLGYMNDLFLVFRCILRGASMTMP